MQQFIRRQTLTGYWSNMNCSMQSARAISTTTVRYGSSSRPHTLGKTSEEYQKIQQGSSGYPIPPGLR